MDQKKIMEPKNKVVLDADYAKKLALDNSDYSYRTEKNEIFECIENAAKQGLFSYQHCKEIDSNIRAELEKLGYDVRTRLIEWHGKK